MGAQYSGVSRRVLPAVHAGLCHALAGTGPTPNAEFDIQAKQTAQFLQATAGGLPHVLIGDLNIFEGTSVVCEQSPDNTSLAYLRNAGYVDAWNLLRSGQDGTTGMLNRAGCGTPQGASWKRIDYIWSRSSFAPVDVQRFGLVTPGDAAPSDHHGIIATFPNPSDVSPLPPPTPPPPPSPPPAPSDIVLYAKRAAPLVGAWSFVADGTAAGATRIANPDAGAPKILTPTAAPASYFELPFSAAAGVPYRLWVRGRASLTDFKSMRYSVGFWPDGTWDERELYVYKAGGGFKPGDVVTLALVGSEARLYLNGVIAYRSPRAAGTYRLAAVFLSKNSAMGVTSQDVVLGTFSR